MTSARSALPLVITALVLLSGIPPLGFVETVDAQEANIVVEKALDDTPKSQTVSMTVTATGNGTVSVAPTSESRDGGSVRFAFAGWEDLDGSGSGGSNSWTARNGHRYRITYEITVREGVSEGTHSVDVGIDGPVDDGRKRVAARVEVREPAFGGIDSQSIEAVFEQRGTNTFTKTIEIPNTGDGVMRPTEITTGSSPSGISVEATALPRRIRPGDSGEAELQITIDSDVSPGVQEFAVGVSDNLGNSQSFDVQVEVFKPPRVTVQGGEVDVGDVLIGTEESTSIEITEANGVTGLSGVRAEIIDGEPDGDLRFDGLGQVSTGPGGSDSATVIVGADNNAEQHRDLNWNVRLTPNQERGISSTVEVSANVIYPAYYEGVAVESPTIEFDEPRSEASSFTETVDVVISNGGDLDMNVESVEASSSASFVSASVVDAPSSITGLNERTATIELEADASAPETTGEFTVEVRSEEAGDETVTQRFEISQDPDLSVSSPTVQFGEVILTRTATESTRISEALGYEGITGLEVQKVSGPDQWLQVTEQPSGQLSAGSDAPLVMKITFDTSAELFKQYTWKYRVSGEGVESQVITVRARAKPVSFEQIRRPLVEHEDQGGWQAETTGPMIEALDGLEQRLKDGEEVSDSDISTALAAARSTSLFVDSVESAEATIESDGHDAAQPEVIRAAAAYNSMTVQANSFNSSGLQSSASESAGAAESRISDLLSEQAEYYRSELESDDTTLRETAQIKRQLAQLAFLRGNEQRAERLRSESKEASDEYIARIEQGSEQRLSAREMQESMTQSTVTVVFDRWLVLNPMAWDTFERQSEEVLSRYDAARNTFSKAGAEQEVRTISQTRSEVAAQVQFARYSLYVSTGLYVIVLVALLGHLTRGMYHYVRDSRARVSGDFLL